MKQFFPFYRVLVTIHSLQGCDSDGKDTAVYDLYRING